MSDHEFDSSYSDDEFFEEESSSENEYEEGDDIAMKKESEIRCKKSLYDNGWSSTPPSTPLANDFSFSSNGKLSTNSMMPLAAFSSIISDGILDR